MTRRGNHKSAEEQGKHITKALTKDVTHGFLLPILPSAIQHLPGAMVQPLRMAEQLTLSKSGERVPKSRLTQDLSFSLTKPDISVNARIGMTPYPKMVYGWCLLRIIHFVVALHAQHPTTRICITKYDYSDAYRHITHAASAADQSIALFGGLAFIAIRLTFGGSPNPLTWCLFFEMVTDLANESSCERTGQPQHSTTQTSRPPPKHAPDGLHPLLLECVKYDSETERL